MGLDFSDNQLRALKLLIKNDSIPREFFYYWNDMINTTGYSAKLLLACAALDSLATENTRREKREEILGKELAEIIFKQKIGVRHRLSHGEYLTQEADRENYLDQIYTKVIDFFNDKIFEEELITKEVINPQRHFVGNNEVWRGFIELGEIQNEKFGLRKLMDKGMEFNSVDEPREY